MKATYRAVRYTLGDRFVVEAIDTLGTYATYRDAYQVVDDHRYGPHGRPFDCVDIVDDANYSIDEQGTRRFDAPATIGKQLPGTILMDECIRDEPVA